MNIDPKIVRGAFIGKKIKEIIEKKGVTITEISERISTAQPAISNALNAKKSVSDDFFKRIANGIPITEIEMKQIFKEADKKEFEYKYGEDIDLIPQADLEIIPDKEKIKLEVIDELGDDFIKELSLSRKFRNNETLIDEAREIWAFMKEEAKKIKKKEK